MNIVTLVVLLLCCCVIVMCVGGRGVCDMGESGYVNIHMIIMEEICCCKIILTVLLLVQVPENHMCFVCCFTEN